MFPDGSKIKIIMTEKRYKIKDPRKMAGHRKRLRDKFLQAGLDGFLDYEIVELLLTLGGSIKDCKQQAKQAIKKFTLSARAYHRILKVARTIADLSVTTDSVISKPTRFDLVDKIKTEHLAEAIQYRAKITEEIF